MSCENGSTVSAREKRSRTPLIASTWTPRLLRLIRASLNRFFPQKLANLASSKCHARYSGWSSLTTPWGFPCFVRFPCVHAAATTPAQRLGVLLRSLHPAVSAFPERVVGSACALSVSRLARRSLALRPAHSRCHQFVTR